MGKPKEKKEKTNGLVGAKTGGMGKPKQKRENEWISRALKQGAEWANLSKKRENEWISRG